MSENSDYFTRCNKCQHQIQFLSEFICPELSDLFSHRNDLVENFPRVILLIDQIDITRNQSFKLHRNSSNDTRDGCDICRFSRTSDLKRGFETRLPQTIMATEFLDISKQLEVYDD